MSGNEQKEKREVGNNLRGVIEQIKTICENSPIFSPFYTNSDVLECEEALDKILEICKLTLGE